MTGWRIGYGAGPAALIGAMAVVQSQSTSNPSSVSQAAAIEALTGPQDYLAERRDDFRLRRDLVVDGLNAICGIDCPRPQGAFYTFASCAGMLERSAADGRRIASDRGFCAYLLDVAKVAVVPGSVFGASPFFRISYASSYAELEEALSRIAQACSRLQR
jgi:aspartate aminotransferase